MTKMKLPALKEIVEERKEKSIESLSDSFAKNKLPLEEYERLVEYINKIESERELVVVEKMVREYAADYDSNGTKTEPAVYDDDDDEYHSVYKPNQQNSGSNITILSNRTVNGPVKSGAQFVSILGSECIKIRKADLSKRRTKINVVSILGDSTVMVESGIRVINKAIPILGNAEIDYRVENQARENEPELVISGAALLGNITIKLLKQ